MTEALDPAANVYEGVWTDWTKGSTWGLTVTLAPEQAVLLTNGLAVFVTLAGSQLWTIIRFTLHQTQNSPTKDATSPTQHTKQQLILRNAPTDLATARLMTGLAWSARREKVSARTIAIAIFALVHAVLFMVAGTFSNRAIQLGTTADGALVLSRSQTCGMFNETYLEIAGFGNNPSDNETFALSTQFIAHRTRRKQLSLQYAQECYLQEHASQHQTSTCNTLKTSKLSWTTRDGDCPFEQSICHSQASALIMDTGVIDSHKDLGINARPKDRLTYQKRTTCAVLNDTEHVKGWDGDIEIGPSQVQKETAYAYYGPVLYMGDDPSKNFTYTYSNFASLFDSFSSQAMIPYQIASAYALGATEPQWTASDFEPIPGLVQKSADVVLFFLSFTGRYLTQIDDPWFSAHESQPGVSSIPLMETLYRRDSAISTLGCTEQHQFCTNSGICTGFAGFDQVQNNAEFNGALSELQNVTLDRLLRAATAGTFGRILEDISVTSTPITAARLIAYGSQVVSRELPTDQWKRELDFWQSIALAHIQRTLIEFGTGQVAADPAYLLPPQSKEDKWFCDNLLIPSTVFQSFSMMAMLLILFFGTLVIGISLNVERIARVVRRYAKRTAPKKAWDHDDMLKLSSRIRDSIFRPKPPPKSPNYSPETSKSGLSRQVATPTIRHVSSSDSVTTVDESCRRSSSPTLPLSEKVILSLGQEMTPKEASNFLAPPEPVHRYDRDSWMAISLNDEDTNACAAPKILPTQIVPPMREMEERRHSPIFRNFNLKGPPQYHLPLNRTLWV